MESLCYNSKILNIEEIQNNNEKLINDKKYYPRLIRIFLTNDYYLSLDKDTYIQCARTKNHTPMDDVRELYEWVDENNSYDNFVYLKELKKLIKKLDTLYTI